MPFTNNFTPTVWINKSEQATGTPDVSAESLIARDQALFDVSEYVQDLSVDFEALQTDVAPLLAGAFVDQSYVAGLQVRWQSATQIQIDAGAAYIPSVGAPASISTTTTLAPSLSASAWHYVYALKIGANLSFEASTTAPAVYFGKSRQKTGDASRRYVPNSAFKTNASSQIIKFQKTGPWHRWLEDTMNTPFRLINLTSAIPTVETNQSCATVVPPTSRMAKLFFLLDNFGNTGNRAIYFGTPDDAITLGSATSFAPGPALFYITSSFQEDLKSGEFHLPLDATQQFNWRGSGTSARIMVSVLGYHEELT